jgi:hypothetical protein
VHKRSEQQERNKGSVMPRYAGEEELDSKKEAEAREKYFSEVKFSTQMLISLWKRGLRRS